MALELLLPPEAGPITLAEAKAHLRVDHSSEDTYITSLIAAAVSRVDGRSGMLQRAIMTQSWRLTLDAFPSGAIEIPLPPLQTIDDAVYVDAGGDPVPLDYVVDDASEPARLFAMGSAWPAGVAAQQAVSIDFTAGYETAADVPAAIIHGMLLLIGNWYQVREQMIIGAISQPLAPNVGIDALFSPYRIMTA